MSAAGLVGGRGGVTSGHSARLAPGSPWKTASVFQTSPELLFSSPVPSSFQSLHFLAFSRLIYFLSSESRAVPLPLHMNDAASSSPLASNFFHSLLHSTALCEPCITSCGVAKTKRGEGIMTLTYKDRRAAERAWV